MTALGVTAGARIEELGDGWAAYSAANGQTHLLNDESALLVAWLIEHGPADAATAAAALAPDLGLDAADLTTRIEIGWGRLIDAGLVQQTADGARHSSP